MHGNLCGPMELISIRGSRFFLVLDNVLSKMVFHYLKNKSEINLRNLLMSLKPASGTPDSVRTSINKIRRLRQGDHPASAYASDFRLLAADIP